MPTMVKKSQRASKGVGLLGSLHDDNKINFFIACSLLILQQSIKEKLFLFLIIYFVDATTNLLFCASCNTPESWVYSLFNNYYESLSPGRLK